MKYDKKVGSIDAKYDNTVVLVYQEAQEGGQHESLTISIPIQKSPGSLENNPFNITLFNPSSKRGRVNLFKLHEILGEDNTKRLVDKLGKYPIYLNNDNELVLKGEGINNAPLQLQYMIKELQSAQREYENEQNYLREYTKQKIQKETKLTEELLNKEKNIDFHK